jgi:hypothetical protein
VASPPAKLKHHPNPASRTGKTLLSYLQASAKSNEVSLLSLVGCGVVVQVIARKKPAKNLYHII